MKVYIEYVILNNFTVNYMILYTVADIVRRKKYLWRLIASSIIGMVYAILSPYIVFSFNFILKVILSLIMVAVAYRHVSVREYIIDLLGFYIVTFLFGGIVIGIGFLFGTDFVNILLYPDSLLPTYISLIILVIAVFIRVIYAIMSRYIRTRSYYYNVRIRVGDEAIDVRGYLDTGNRLYKDLSMVVVLDGTLVDELFDDTCATPIQLDTIDGTSERIAYHIDEIDLEQRGIHKNYKNIYAVESIRDFIDYKVLLNADM